MADEPNEDTVAPEAALDPEQYTLKDFLARAADYSDLNIDAMRGEPLETPGATYEWYAEWAARSALIQLMEQHGFTFPQSEKDLAARIMKDLSQNKERILADYQR